MPTIIRLGEPSDNGGWWADIITDSPKHRLSEQGIIFHPGAALGYDWARPEHNNGVATNITEATKGSDIALLWHASSTFSSCAAFHAHFAQQAGIPIVVGTPDLQSVPSNARSCLSVMGAHLKEAQTPLEALATAVSEFGLLGGVYQRTAPQHGAPELAFWALASGVVPGLVPEFELGDVLADEDWRTRRYDFAVPEVGLLIEVDGEHHRDPAVERDDRHKAELAYASGYFLTRFSSRAVDADPLGCVNEVLALSERLSRPAPTVPYRVLPTRTSWGVPITSSRRVRAPGGA